MDGAEQVQTHLKAKVGSHAMKGKQLKEQQEYRFTQLIPNLGGVFFPPLHSAVKMLKLDTLLLLDTLPNSTPRDCL